MFIDGNNNITIIRSDEVTIGFKIDDYDFVIGDKVIFMIGDNYFSTYIIKKEIIEFDVVDGCANIVLSADETSILAGEYVYDIRVELADGRKETVIRGDWIVKGKVFEDGCNDNP